MSLPYQHIQVSNGEEMTLVTTEIVHKYMVEGITKNGKFTIGLSGGSSPKDLYIAMSKFEDVDWSKVYIMLIDDRYVPNDHKDSNQKLVRDTILKNIEIPNENVIFPNCELEISKLVEDYEDRIAKSAPRLDLSILGMGDDGHYASLFPPVKEELLNSKKIVVSTIAPEKFSIKQRISTTMQYIMKAKVKMFLLKNNKNVIFGKMKEEFTEIFGKPDFEENMKKKTADFPVLPYLNDANATMICENF